MTLCPESTQSYTPTAALMRCIAEAAKRGEDLPSALSNSSLPAAKAVARSLSQGYSLPEACQDYLHPELARILAGPRPGPEESALLLAQLLDERYHARRNLLGALVYPLSSLLIFCLALPIISSFSSIALPWTALLAPLALALLLPLLILFHLGRQRPLQLSFCDLGWQQAIQQAERWQQSAAILSWRLPEAEAERLFSRSAARLAAACGGDPAGIAHCHSMADYHRQRARQRSRSLALMLGVWIQLCGGWIAILLATALWQDIGGHLDLEEATAQEDAYKDRLP